MSVASEMNMNQPEKLLQRLDEIGAALEQSGLALALIGLGSIGLEQSRLDVYSDLDFFVIARDGCRMALIDNLGWLQSIQPVVYAFQNSADGCKALFADGVFCEFGVFEAGGLAQVPFSEGRLVWSAPDFDARLARPQRGAPPPEAHSREWMVGEALTCLYVGLGRYRRGEKLSALRFVQSYSIDRVLELSALLEPAAPALPDAFSVERRFEQRFPQSAAALPGMLLGYDQTPQSARAILDWLEQRFEVNTAIKAAILERCEAPEKPLENNPSAQGAATMPAFEPFTLKTPRLALCFMEEAHLDGLYRIFSHPEVMRYWAWPAWERPEQAIEMLAGVQEGYRSGEALRLAVELRAERTLIGTVSLFHFHTPSRRAELGYALGRPYWGAGYMHEALQALLQYAFESLELNRLEADIDPLNLASARVLERLGFQLEGRLRERWIVNGETSDTWLYGLLRREWLQAA